VLVDVQQSLLVRQPFPSGTHAPQKPQLVSEPSTARHLDPVAQFWPLVEHTD
jgi:hypothetical protein